MSHVAEGSLQAYIDGEIGGAEYDALRDHLAVCVVCSSELATMSRSSKLVHEALSSLDVAAPLLRARAHVSAERRRANRVARLGTAGLAKAAMLLLALGGVVSAAIPESPVRRALEATYARVAQLINGPGMPEPVADLHEPTDRPDPMVARVVESVSVMPSNGQIRIILHPPAGMVEVTVRIIDGGRANVVTSMENEAVRFLRGTGRVEVSGMGMGEVTIELPRSLQAGSVVVGSDVVAEKSGEGLRLRGSAQDAQGSEVRFRIGS
jgi:hypothetical protein